jgi:hypothetical protein
VASAVGDGSTAIRLIHDYLALASPDGYARVDRNASTLRSVTASQECK